MGNNVYGAIALKTSSGALDLIDGINLLPGDIALVVTDTNSYFYKLFSNDISQENSPYIIKPVLNGSNKRWRLTSISETSGDLSVLGKLMVNKIGFTGNTLSIISTDDTELATFDKIGQSVSFKKISSVEDTSIITGLNAEKVGGKSGNLMMLTDGSEVFTAPIVGVSPTLDSHLATKIYVDTLINAINTSTATDFTVSNILTTSIINTPSGSNLLIKNNGNTLAAFDATSVSFNKITSVANSSMVNGLNAEFIQGQALDGFMTTDGSVSFTAPVSGVSPTQNSHLTTKNYVDSTKAVKGANSDITSLSALTTPLSISQGGTGASTQSEARTNLGLGNASTLTAGTSANNLVQLDSSGYLPAVDGRNLINLNSDDNISRDNIAMNTFVTWLLAARVTGEIPSGKTYTFQTDELTNINGLYDIVGDYYGNTSGGGLSAPNNLTADGTSNFSSGGISGYAAYRAFDGADKTASGNGWQSPNDGNVIGKYIGRHFGATGRTVGRMLIWNSQASAPWRNGVKDIVVEGSNDAVANGSGGLSTVGTWTKIPVLAVTGGSVINTDEARINQESGTGVAATAEITLGGSTAYKAVRIRCTSASWGGYSPDYVQIRELEMYDAVVSGDMTLTSPVFSSGQIPTKVTLYLLHKSIDTVTLNTDIKISATRNSDWAEATDLTTICTYDSEYKLLKASVDLASLTSGTNVAWKIQTFNTKSQRVRAALIWAE